MIHAHVESRSRDCDGDYSRGHLSVMTFEEQTEQFGDLIFKDRVVTDVINLHGHGRLDVTPAGVSWYEDTDEGYRASSVTWCEDECGPESPWQRDHRAESMGY